MIALNVSSNELSAGSLHPDTLGKAVEAIRRDGFVVLENVVSLDSIAVLREKALEDVKALLARPDAPFNFNTGNLQQDPPPFPPYLFRDVLVNDFVAQVTGALLGPGVKNAFYSGNTALPSDACQPVHPDVGQLWSGMDTASPAFGLVVNVPLVDMSATNGATELWPETHTDTTKDVFNDIKVSVEDLDRWRNRTTPLQPTVAAGGVVIRDIRLWHRGMPNHSDQPRPMIAMIHWVRWWSDMAPLKFPRGTEALFEHPILNTHAVFVDGPIDYLHSPQAYDFQPTESR